MTADAEVTERIEERQRRPDKLSDDVWKSKPGYRWHRRQRSLSPDRRESSRNRRRPSPRNNWDSYRPGNGRGRSRSPSFDDEDLREEKDYESSASANDRFKRFPSDSRNLTKYQTSEIGEERSSSPGRIRE